MGLEQEIEEATEKVVRADNFSKDTLTAMAERCKSQGCEMENCCSFVLQVYQRCRWCGKTGGI